MSYIVRCALPSGHTHHAPRTAPATSYSFAGAIGVAPEWETGTCNTTCQERMTGVLARAREHLGRAHPDLARQRGRDRLGPEHQLPVPGGLVLRQHLREPAQGLLLQRQGLQRRARCPAASASASRTRPTSDPFGTPGPCATQLHGLLVEDQRRRRRLLVLLRLHPRRDRVAQLRRQHAVLASATARTRQVPRGRGQQHVERARRSRSARLQRVDATSSGRSPRSRPASTSSMNVATGKALDTERRQRPPTTPRWCRHSYSGSGTQLWSAAVAGQPRVTAAYYHAQPLDQVHREPSGRRRATTTTARRRSPRRTTRLTSRSGASRRSSRQSR